MEKKEVVLSWQDFQTYADKIVSDIKEKGKSYDVIVGVARGGLFLAGYLSYHLVLKK